MKKMIIRATNPPRRDSMLTIIEMTVWAASNIILQILIMVNIDKSKLLRGYWMIMINIDHF